PTHPPGAECVDADGRERRGQFVDRRVDEAAVDVRVFGIRIACRLGLLPVRPGVPRIRRGTRLGTVLVGAGRVARLGPDGTGRLGAERTGRFVGEGIDVLVVLVVEDEEDAGDGAGAQDEVDVPVPALGDDPGGGLAGEVDAQGRRTRLCPTVIGADDEGHEAVARRVAQRVGNDADDVLWG